MSMFETDARVKNHTTGLAVVTDGIFGLAKFKFRSSVADQARGYKDHLAHTTASEGAFIMNGHGSSVLASESTPCDKID